MPCAVSAFSKEHWSFGMIIICRGSNVLLHRPAFFARVNAYHSRRVSKKGPSEAPRQQHAERRECQHEGKFKQGSGWTAQPRSAAQRMPVLLEAAIVDVSRKLQTQAVHGWTKPHPLC